MTSQAANPSDYLVSSADPVHEAEAMALDHLAREAEVKRVAELVRWLDDLVRVPGTKFGIGLDAVVGFLLPGVGDAITGVTSLALLRAGIRRGVPTVVLLRMLLNIGIDAVGGLLPGIGDAFDLLWRSNIRNLALLERHEGELEPQSRFTDYAIMAGAVGLVGASIAAPFFLFAWIASALF